uniref:ShKT domain-containing protein n=1 Tax=Strongyloides stercoralis TaxID=6248 RepID=A0A0K0DZS0_STRER
MFYFLKKYLPLQCTIILSLFASFIYCAKKNDPVAKFLYKNENICGDLFADPNWLPAQFKCRIRCNNLKEVCMTGVNENNKIFTCRTLPIKCSEELQSYLINNGFTLKEFQINEPKGPPIMKKFNDIFSNTYKLPPSAEPHPPSLAPDNTIYENKNSLPIKNEEYSFQSPPSTTPYIDQAKKYEEDFTFKVDEPFVVEQNVYDNEFIKPTPSSYYRPVIETTTSNYPTTEAPIQVSNEVIDNYGTAQSSMPSINVQSSMPSINVQPLIPSVEIQPPISSINVQPSMPSIEIQQPIPSVNVESSMPSINIQPLMPSYQIQPSNPPANIQSSMPSINIQPLPVYVPSPVNYNQKLKPTSFNIPSPVFTYNLHNEENHSPGYGPPKESSQYNKATNYHKKNRLLHVPTLPSKYGYYYDGYNYKKTTWKQGNKKLKKKVLYSNSEYSNGLRDLSTKCCSWALNGMCDGYWQRIRLICPKSCGTVICTTGNGKTGCNRAIDVNVYDCDRKNNIFLKFQQNILYKELPRQYYNQYDNYRSNNIRYQRNDYVNDNPYPDNTYAIENELVGWKRMFNVKKT